MKANRKFLRNDDDAVSPVIAVILMVAITVVLAATVYVWVSGFNTGTSSTKSISLTSGGPLNDGATPHTKDYVVASASPGFKWSGIKFSLNGDEMEYWTAGTAASLEAGEWCLWDGATGACDSTQPTTALIEAGQQIRIGGTSLSGQTLRALDVDGNNVLSTIVVS